VEIDVAALLGLRLRTARLELRLPTEAEIGALADVARRGVHPPDRMPFAFAWTDTARSESFGDDFAAFHLGLRETWRPDAWTFECGVWADGKLVGAQGLNGVGFHHRREVSSGSWLGRTFQGNGYGTEMRAAILHLAFAGLGAEVAESGALEGNAASERVSEKLGYARAGERTVTPRGAPVREQIFRLDAATWASSDRIAVTVVGLDACRPLFGST
jgi:RimJ/RimL family protein N-acetyltransferase